SIVESKLTQENNSIKASVQDLNSTTQSITTNVSNINRDLTSKINSNLDAAKNFATDIATNKANTAKQEAINNAKAYTNAEITTVNSKVHNVESNLNILSDRINTKVSQSDIDKAVTTIRTERIIYARGTGNDYPANSIVKVNGKTITDGQGRGLRIHALNKNTLELIFWQDYDTFGSEDAKVSFVNKINELNNSEVIIIITSQDASYPLHPPIKEALEKIGATLFDNKQETYREAYALIGKSKLGRGNGVEMFIPRTANDKRFAEVSVKVGEDGTFIGVNPNNMGLETTLIKSNISDVSSSVTQLRDSITTQINSINSKTQSIETTLGGKASKQEVTEVNNKVATIKASLDGIIQRVSATESKTQTLESNINGKASKQEVNNVSSKVVSLETNLNGITNRVSSTESRINALDGKVAGAVTLQQFTEFKQSNDKFKFTVEQRSSVSNILPNSSFFGGDRGWLHDGVEFWYGSYSGYGFKGRMTGAIKNRTSYNNPERFLQTHKAYKVKKNTTYTISFHYACEMNIHSMEAYVVLSDTEHGDYAQPIRILEKPGGTQSDPNNDIPFTYKFNTGNHEWVWLRFDHNGMKPGTNWDQYCWLYVSEIGIYEGDVGAVKWTPKGGEVYSANYQMDGLGFKGTFEDGTYAQLGRDGFEWYNAGTGHAYHALTYVTSFDVPIGNPGKAYIKLPAEFTKRRSSLKWTVALRGYYYSTDGDFFPFHIHCTGGRDYIENGLVVCEVQGYCKIQNAQNAGDVQFRPLTAMLIAIA
ncbi:interleukin-like EMT inducer domain-containing protein, partial [Clostridium perfringens]|uniref:interleukin-like EMT inducer domain-containing protein n=2 Tax=Clostridium TaxID=1485 RepID=UPI002AF6C0EE